MVCVIAAIRRLTFHAQMAADFNFEFEMVGFNAQSTYFEPLVENCALAIDVRPSRISSFLSKIIFYYSISQAQVPSRNSGSPPPPQ